MTDGAGRLIVSAIAVAAALSTVQAGVTRAAPFPQGPPAAERTLHVDFYALGADGLGIADLRTEEVTVRVDGRARPVRSLRLLRQGPVPAADPLAPAIEPPMPYQTNRIAEAGRSFIVAIDDESFRPGRERPIRSALRVFLGALTTRDRVSLWTMPHGGIKVNFTGNHDRIAAAMDLVSGHAPDQESGSDAACRTRTTLQALEHMLSSVTGGEGPTTVLFFTASLFGPRRDATRAIGPPGMCELRIDEFQAVGHAAARARAHFYVIQPEDLQRRPTNAVETLAGTGFAATMNPLEGIEHLAGVTGGVRMSLTRLGDASLLGVAKSTASYYSAVIDAPSSDNDGAHGLDVKVNRPGVEVRSRPFVHTGKPGGLIPRPATPAEMVRTAAVFPDLPLRVAAYATQNDASGTMRVVVAAEPEDAGVVLTAASIGYFDSQGRMVGQTNLKTELTVMPMLATAVVPPGAYRVRVAATDSTGRSGAADTEISVEMTSAGSLRLSSVVLGVWRNEAFQPRLQFSSEPVAIAHLDIVGGSAGMAVSALVELSRSLSGPALTTTRLVIQATSDPTRFTATGAIPIGGLPPGDYVVRAIVGVDGQTSGRVVRVLRKVDH